MSGQSVLRVASLGFGLLLCLLLLLVAVFITFVDPRHGSEVVGYPLLALAATGAFFSVRALVRGPG